MATPFENLTDLRDRVLSSLKAWILDIRSGTWRRLHPVVVRVVVWIVSIYRLGLRRVVFIGITGSCGKTTTKEMVAAVLSSQYKGYKSRGSNNLLKEVVWSILLTRPGYEFCVQEFGVGGIGESIPKEKQFQMLKPQIGVVTTIGEIILARSAVERRSPLKRAKLISALPKHGTAILNADDENVLAMQEKCAGRVVTYGLNEKAMVRAVKVSSRWPERLSFTVLYGDQSQFVQTQLCGTHLVPCVLAALAVGGNDGEFHWRWAAQTVQGRAAISGRMSPVSLPGGATVIRDDFKAPLWTIPSALKFMEEAEAKRKIVVVGTISDISETNHGNAFK